MDWVATGSRTDLVVVTDEGSDASGLKIPRAGGAPASGAANRAAPRAIDWREDIEPRLPVDLAFNGCY